MRLAIIIVTLILWATPAYAVTVAIVEPPSSTPDFTETLSRLQGELLSVGFEVKLVVPAEVGGATEDSRAWLEALAAEEGIDAVIVIVGDAAPVAVEICVVERAPPRLEISRVEREGNGRNAAARLAIRAVEVLRSTFLENDMAARGRYDESDSDSSRVEGREPVGRVERFGGELGAAVLYSADGLAPALLPLGRFDFAARPWLVLQASVAALGSRPTVATTEGNARVAQHFGVLGARVRSPANRGLWPFATLSGGVLRTSVDGEADPPRQGHSADQWSFLLDGGVGAGLNLPDRYFLTLAAHVQVAEPYVAIHFVDATVATIGHPNLALTLTAGGWP